MILAWQKEGTPTVILMGPDFSEASFLCSKGKKYYQRVTAEFPGSEIAEASLRSFASAREMVGQSKAPDSVHTD